MNVLYHGKFKKDLERLVTRGKDVEKLKVLVKLILAGEPIPAKYKPHPLIGQWKGFMDAHVEPDWLLLYRIENDTLHLARTGTHSDLF
jgi:mRNA interferase YafQ